jgi:TRAP-type mannitol/chloroaromatic compound transport system substrate-binding protein
MPAMVALRQNSCQLAALTTPSWCVCAHASASRRFLDDFATILAHTLTGWWPFLLCRTGWISAAQIAILNGKCRRERPNRIEKTANHWREIIAMKRRQFIKAAGLGVAASAIAAPAIAQSTPTLKWRLTMSWPKSLDILSGACETFSKYVSEATDGKFQIQVFAAGEIVPGLQVLDAIQNSTVEMGHTAVYYYIGKDPTWALFCATPFGLNCRQQNSWFYDGDGQKLADDFTKKYNAYSLLMGNTGAQMGGWFRKEINTVDDLKGLKMRIGGWAGATLKKLGVVSQQIAGGDIYPALEKGTIDATEWVGPYDDEKLGFYKVAKYYYYPGWWEGGTTNHLLINLAKWNELPKSYQAIVKAAAGFANVEETARYDARNPQALKRLLAAGTQLRPFSTAVMEACLKASNEVNAETSAINADYKKVWNSIAAFRNDEYLWWQVAEYSYDSFQIRTRARG